jgi:glutathione S-transferase
MTIKLHCFGESGHSYKAALGLTLAGIDWEPVRLDFFAGEGRGEAYRAQNAMGEVPLLVLDDGTRLSQSGVILRWIADTHGRFWPDTASYEVLRWVLWDNHKLSALLGQLRFMTNFLPEEKRSADVIGFLRGRSMASLAILEAHLTGRKWIAADEPTAADLSCCSYLFYPEPFGFDRAALPAIDAWLARIEALHGWAHPYDLMPRAYPAAA